MHVFDYSHKLLLFRILLMSVWISVQAPEHSVPLLTQLLEDRIIRMRTQLTNILSNNLTIADNTQLDQLYEDIHWLLLIAGEMLW